MKYGMPYKGSKSKIAEQILSVLPEADYFVDLFGGGGAMTHCATLSFKYRKVIYNEIEPLIHKAFDMAIHGGFRNENRWISREDFFRLKDTDPYAAICFSFGNDCKTYAYSKELEPWKKALHYARRLHDTSLFKTMGIPTDGTRRDIQKHNAEYMARYKEWLQEESDLGRLFELEHLERLQNLERLQCLESLDRLDRLDRLDYRQVSLPDDAVVYCDIPYKSTNTYLSSFDYEAFYEWARNQEQDVFISEYDMPDDFYLVTEFDRTYLLSPDSRDTVKERLYCNHKYETHEQLTFF